MCGDYPAGNMLDDMLAETPERFSSDDRAGNDAVSLKAANGRKDAAHGQQASER